jgi:type VI secretion system protein ImpK
MLEQRLAAKNRVRAEGRADTEPVAPNDSPANMAQNRRVVVTLLVAPTERDAQLVALPAATPPAATPPAKGR